MSPENRLTGFFGSNDSQIGSSDPASVGGDFEPAIEAIPMPFLTKREGEFKQLLGFVRVCGGFDYSVTPLPDGGTLRIVGLAGSFLYVVETVEGDDRSFQFLIPLAPSNEFRTNLAALTNFVNARISG